MIKQPRSFSPEEKAQVAIVAIKGEQTIAQICSSYQVHPTQIGHWKNQALNNLSELFKDKRKKEKQDEFNHQIELENLYKLIGQRETELDWLKKKLSVFNPS